MVGGVEYRRFDDAIVAAVATVRGKQLAIIATVDLEEHIALKSQNSVIYFDVGEGGC